MSRRGDEPRRLGDALAEVNKHLRLPEPQALGGVFGGWEDIVGAEIAAHVQPRTLRDGTLTVVVDDNVWATQMRFLEGDLVRRIQRVAGPASVASIQVVVDLKKRRS